MRAALAEDRPHAVLVAQPRQRARAGRRLPSAGSSTSARTPSSECCGRGDDHHARGRVLQQRQVGGQVQRAADDDRQRVGLAGPPRGAARGAPRRAPCARSARRAACPRRPSPRPRACAGRGRAGGRRGSRSAPCDRAPSRGRRRCGPCSPRCAGAPAARSPTAAAPRRARRRSARPGRAAGGAARRAARCEPPSRDRVAGLDGVLDGLEEDDLLTRRVLAPRTVRAGSRRGRRGSGAPRWCRRTSSGSRRGSAARAGRDATRSARTCRCRRRSGRRRARRGRSAQRGIRCTASASAISPRRYVRFSRDRQARKRAGSKLHCVAKPITQPSRRSSLAAVTMNSG